MSSHIPAHASAAPAGPAPARTAVRTAPAGSASHPAGPHIQGRQTLLRSVRAEWIKFWSLRSSWITSFITITLTVLFGAGLTAAFGRSEQYQDVAKDFITSGLTFGQVVVAVLGALIITGEYSSGQIRSSLAAVPRRGQLLLAKAVVLAVVSFLLGSLSVFLPGRSPSPSSASTPVPSPTRTTPVTSGARAWSSPSSHSWLWGSASCCAPPPALSP